MPVSLYCLVPDTVLESEDANINEHSYGLKKVIKAEAQGGTGKEQGLVQHTKCLNFIQ